jgi:uncharacterized C2H2 Zn-finger protein
MKKLNLLIALLILGLSAQAQLTESNLKTTKIYKSKTGWQVIKYELEESISYTIHYRNAAYVHIYDGGYETIGDLDDVINFFESIINVCEDVDKVFENELFYIAHTNKRAAYVSARQKSQHFYILKKEAQKILDILKD